MKMMKAFKCLSGLFESQLEFEPEITIYLDIDENLISVGKKHLSESAMKDLSNTPIGTRDNPVEIAENWKINEGIFAFRQQEWTDFFNAVIAINNEYKKRTNKDKPLINIKFLTNASYEGELFIQNVFKHFFGESITSELVPNPKEQVININKQCEILSAAGLSELNTFYSQARRSNDGELARLLKAQFKAETLNVLHGNQKNKEKVILVDDSIENLMSVKRYGFRVIHNPSAKKKRMTVEEMIKKETSFFRTLVPNKKDTSYTKNKDKTFEELNGILKPLVKTYKIKLDARGGPPILCPG
ncbi:TPA: hypothetical protein ACTXXA_003501 [Legionella anisa]